MDIFTHLVFGALIYNLFLKEVTYDYLQYAIFIAVLPDLDVFIAPLKRVFKSNYLEHRSGSHSYVIGVIISAIIGAIYSIVTQQSFFVIWIIGIFFYGTHVSLDLLNTTKIPCFYPISKKEYCFYVEKAGSSFTLVTSVIFLIHFLIFYNPIPDLITLYLIINIWTYFMLIYYSYRILTKIWISSRLEENQKYFPGVLPFYYIIFEKEIVGDTISLHLEKKSHFSRSKLIYKNNATLLPQEMELLKEALRICMETYYYAKWTVLPIFFRNDNVFSIRFFFIEPMVRSRAMYNQFDFDKNTSRLIDNKQRYSHI